jgi:rSAM/selenodomain-associated transferase 2
VNISVIIPALNEASFIERAIETAWAAGAFEVIVVEGGSQDNTLALANAAKCRLLDSEPGRAKQQNAGAELAIGDVLLFQHADTWLDGTSISQIRELLSDDTIIAGGFRQQIDANGWLFRVLETGNARRISRRGLPFGDQGIFIRRDIFSQLGQFPDVPLMEDLILMKKVRRLAKPCLLPGSIYVSARRWQRHGVVRQTLRNHLLRALHHCGASPAFLTRFYRRHDR